VVLSPNTINSPWVRQEINIAQAMEHQEKASDSVIVAGRGADGFGV